MNIAYDAHLGLYIGQPEAVVQDSSEPQRFYATDNLATQKWRLLGDTGGYRTGSWYRWMLDSVNRTGSTIVGKKFRSYCSFQCSNGTDGEYYETVVDTSVPAAPVASGKTCTIASGTGRLLAQVRGGAATTSLAGGGSSLSSRWKFTSNGDGSYRIANASTGGLLGFDATSDAGRAWGAKPTVTAAPAGGPTVGQQWFVVPSTTTRGAATGTYRLVNRYSGLVLGLSGNPTRPAETTPTRAWTDTRRPGRRGPHRGRADAHSGPVQGVPRTVTVPTRPWAFGSHMAPGRARSSARGSRSPGPGGKGFHGRLLVQA